MQFSLYVKTLKVNPMKLVGITLNLLPAGVGEFQHIIFIILLYLLAKHIDEYTD